MGWSPGARTLRDNYEYMKSRGDVLVTFDGLSAVYMAFPDKFDLGSCTILYRNSNIGAYQRLVFSTFKDFKRYSKWLNEKETQERNDDQKKRQDQFWKSVSNLYGVGGKIAPGEDEPAETQFQAVELYATFFGKAHVFECRSCNRQFVHIPEYNGMKQQLNYCPLCGAMKRGRARLVPTEEADDGN